MLYLLYRKSLLLPDSNLVSARGVLQPSRKKNRMINGIMKTKAKIESKLTSSSDQICSFLQEVSQKQTWGCGWKGKKKDVSGHDEKSFSAHHNKSKMEWRMWYGALIGLDWPTATKELRLHRRPLGQRWNGSSAFENVKAGSYSDLSVDVPFRRTMTSNEHQPSVKVTIGPFSEMWDIPHQRSLALLKKTLYIHYGGKA